MAESQKRESRTRDKQKEEIVKLETEKMRLLNFK